MHGLLDGTHQWQPVRHGKCGIGTSIFTPLTLKGLISMGRSSLCYSILVIKSVLRLNLLCICLLRFSYFGLFGLISQRLYHSVHFWTSNNNLDRVQIYSRYIRNYKKSIKKVKQLKFSKCLSRELPIPCLITSVW